ncbi:CU044_5270 family protein [Kitasatospora sp. NPDC092948]|uniref:CU044_5270 family protein n=1 Tax=Kitasatospora sp. NPDC092948 TaxID=3364088 RepID=UPI003824C837
MDEITRLAEFRADTEPMSAHACLRGRQQLADEIAGRPTGRRDSHWRRLVRPRRLLVAAALTLALTAGVVSTQVAGPGATESSAEAISVLNLAADALADAPMPRPDQFVYMNTMHVTSDPTDISTSEGWMSVDGSKPGLGKYSNVKAPERDLSQIIQPGQVRTSLSQGPPYADLAKLPTDPDKLLRILYADPWVADRVSSHEKSRDLAVWDLVRDLLLGACPAPQQAALFRAAAKIPHITYVSEATDALGRTGEAVSMLDPNLGYIQLILDRQTHAFIGERILGRDSGGRADDVEFNSAVRTVGFVDAVEQLPS